MIAVNVPWVQSMPDFEGRGLAAVDMVFSDDMAILRPGFLPWNGPSASQLLVNTKLICHATGGARAENVRFRFSWRCVRSRPSHRPGGQLHRYQFYPTVWPKSDSGEGGTSGRSLATPYSAAAGCAMAVPSLRLGRIRLGVAPRASIRNWPRALNPAVGAAPDRLAGGVKFGRNFRCVAGPMQLNGVFRTECPGRF